MAGNYIKLDRKLLEWEWYKDGNTARIWIHLLLKANWKEMKFQGQTVRRGELITSSSHLAEELGMSRQEVRTALSHLKSTKNLTIKSTNKWMLIKVEKYASFQDKSVESTNNLTINQPATNHKRKKERIKEYKEGEDIGF